MDYEEHGDGILCDIYHCMNAVNDVVRSGELYNMSGGTNAERDAFKIDVDNLRVQLDSTVREYGLYRAAV